VFLGAGTFLVLSISSLIFPSPATSLSAEKALVEKFGFLNIELTPKALIVQAFYLN
jgi:hypothetical protein